MKSFCAIALSLVPEMQDSNSPFTWHYPTMKKLAVWGLKV